MQAINKMAMAGAIAKIVGKEALTRGAQKVPGVGLLVKETGAQKAQRAGSAVSGTASGGRNVMSSARQGTVAPSKSLGSNTRPKLATASLRQTHRDMMDLEKEAMDPSLRQIFSGSVAHAGAGAMMVGGLYGAKKLYSKLETERIWKRLQQENPELTQSPKDRENFEVLQRFSPDIAGNVTTARSYMQRAQQTYMAPHEFVKDLVSVQDVRRRAGLGYALEDVAKHSISTGVDFAKRDGGTTKSAALIDAMNSVYE